MPRNPLQQLRHLPLDVVMNIFEDVSGDAECSEEMYEILVRMLSLVNNQTGHRLMKLYLDRCECETNAKEFAVSPGLGFLGWMERIGVIPLASDFTSADKQGWLQVRRTITDDPGFVFFWKHSTSYYLIQCDMQPKEPRGLSGHYEGIYYTLPYKVKNIDEAYDTVRDKSLIAHSLQEGYLSRVDGNDFLVHHEFAAPCAYLFHLCMSSDTEYEHIRELIVQKTYRDKGYLEMRRNSGDLYFKYVYFRNASPLEV